MHQEQDAITMKMPLPDVDVYMCMYVYLYMQASIYVHMYIRECRVREAYQERVRGRERDVGVALLLCSVPS